MSYLWSDYDENAFYVVDTEPDSQFEEIAPFQLDWRGGMGSTTRRINCLPRFAPIFLPLIESTQEPNGSPEAMIRNREGIENILFHILAAYDRMCGVHSFTLIEEQLRKEIQAGAFGERAKAGFGLLEPKTRRMILTLLARQNELKGRRLLYRQALHAVFPDSHCYFYADDSRLLVFMPECENENGRLILAMLEDLFCDVSCREKRYFWGRHFGIIGYGKTMRINQIEIY